MTLTRQLVIFGCVWIGVTGAQTALAQQCVYDATAGPHYFVGQGDVSISVYEEQRGIGYLRVEDAFSCVG